MKNISRIKFVGTVAEKHCYNNLAWTYEINC